MIIIKNNNIVIFYYSFLLHQSCALPTNTLSGKTENECVVSFSENYTRCLHCLSIIISKTKGCAVHSLKHMCALFTDVLVR